ncbi:HET-domain-containing protein [Cadophora sp. DSE1049]|nr:HET-domain-containing protein [Cadophora sp. DSE1049]
MTTSIPGSMDMEPPRCSVCLDLDWGRMPDDSGDGHWERRLRVPYQSLRDSKDCQICAVITQAISEFSKPLESYHIDFHKFLQSSQIRIFLRDGWTTKVLIWNEKDYLAEPYFELEMYTSTESPSDIPAFCVANKIPPTLDLSSCTHFLIPRIHHFNATHTHCQSKSSQMPSRLLYVGSETNPKCLRLEVLPTLQPYVALSHCWGDQSAIFTTTTATIKDLLLDMPWTKLPKTFQDAIFITRSLKLNYLWIDSLCIIQDDPLDWKTESVKMAEIYSGAYLTIAATGASSATSGCLSTRWHETDLGVKVSHTASQLQSDRISAIHGIEVRYSSKAHTQFAGWLDPPVNGAPLWNRAWAFQERVLSNRLIHFHGEEMIWECRESRECECGYFAWDLKMNHPGMISTLLAEDDIARAYLGPETPLKAFEKWLEIVHEFTKLEIRYELDRLPAISGIASSLYDKLYSSYTAGVWQYGLGYGLLWRKMPYQLSRRVNSIPGQYIPSWSWASVELVSKRSFGLHTYRKNLGIDEHFRSTSPTSSRREIKSILGIQEASLQIKGLVISCTLTHQHEVKSDIYPTHLLKFRGGIEFVYTDITCDNKAAQEEAEVACLLVGATSNERIMTWDDSCSGPYIIQYALVLQSDATGVYTRIGMSEHDRRKGWFDDAKVTIAKVL